ncbi:MAG: DUF484 family protein [Alphaproteobacteria bacterium]
MPGKLATENTQLRRQLKAYISQAHQNEDKLRRFQEQELQFISANGLAELLETLLYDYRRNFNLDAVTLLLLDSEFEIRRILENLGLTGQHRDLLFVDDPADLFELFPREPGPRLGRCEDQCQQLLFPHAPSTLASMALFPLIRNRQLIGLLNIGSLQAERFIQGSATDFLERLAGIVAVCFENALNHERLKLLGLLDPLTGIHNRRYFDERLEEETSRALRQTRPLSCLFLDIDHFKRFNDTWGHQVGDQVLQEVATVIKQQMRMSDVLARFGGEEFAVLLVNTDHEEAMEIAERIRHSIASHALHAEGETLHITLSVGCSTLDSLTANQTPDQAGQQLLHYADSALYQAKELGRNQVCHGDAA